MAFKIIHAKIICLRFDVRSEGCTKLYKVVNRNKTNLPKIMWESKPGIKILCLISNSRISGTNTQKQKRNTGLRTTAVDDGLIKFKNCHIKQFFIRVTYDDLFNFYNYGYWLKVYLQKFNIKHLMIAQIFWQKHFLNSI